MVEFNSDSTVSIEAYYETVQSVSIAVNEELEKSWLTLKTSEYVDAAFAGSDGALVATTVTVTPVVEIIIEVVPMVDVVKTEVAISVPTTVTYSDALLDTTSDEYVAAAASVTGLLGDSFKGAATSDTALTDVAVVFSGKTLV